MYKNSGMACLLLFGVTKALMFYLGLHGDFPNQGLRWYHLAQWAVQATQIVNKFVYKTCVKLEYKKGYIATQFRLPPHPPPQIIRV